MYGLALPNKKQSQETGLSPPLSVKVLRPCSSVKCCHQGEQVNGESILSGAKHKFRYWL